MNGPEGELEPVNILLVDDRPNNLKSLEAALRRPDYNIVVAESGPVALAQVLRREFAVILLDVAMPGMDGFETARIIKEREQSKLIPIIFVTASVYDMEHVFRGYTVGAVDYLRKPADTYQVRAKVAVFAELFRQRKQIERQGIKLREAELREQHMLRARAETALRKSEELYAHTFQHAPIGIGHATPEGTWVAVNEKLCQIVGWKREDMVGTSVAEIVAGDDAVRVVDALGLLKEGDTRPYSEEHRLATPEGRSVWGRLIISSLREDDRVLRLLVIVEDVTDRREAEHERSSVIRSLEHSIRARDDFLSIAAHELKTPLTPLRLQTASLLREANKEGRPEAFPRLVRRLERIDNAARRLEGLVERLLDLSRLSVGAVTLELEDVDLGAIVERVAARLGDERRQSGSTLAIEAPAPVVGRWDRLRLEQVVTNLLSNAIKYGEGKPIDVAVELRGDRAVLSVRDHGVGVAAQDQKLIFERFDRLSPVRHHGGFGIGLWIARSIVEAHGGRIAVASSPGAGSSFTVELPRAAKASDSPPTDVQHEAA